MSITPAILEHYPELIDSQREVIGHLDGPLLVIAGPGSGKTFSIVLRALNLLLLDKAEPKEIVLCTFTEKAAFEMRDRLAAARKVEYTGDLSELTVSTIHGFCHRVLTQHRHRTELGHNYETLDELTQLLFIHEHFDEIVGPLDNDLFLTRWKTRWTAIEGVRGYFDKITEELVDPCQLTASDNAFLKAIGAAYQRYEQALLQANRVDFAHLQWLVYDLLNNPANADLVSPGLRYLLVDEYQDTNYIQEQLLLKLAEPDNNLCVVGDEDQSLYRFRGATVRNILEFAQRIPNCRISKLTTNYRSHRAIVERYDHWMASANWSNPNGGSFRHDKTIAAAPHGQYPDYPSVISIWGRDRRDEAERFADLVEFLKENEVITDYSQVALLLHSVREDHSGPYIDALKTKGIPAFCPRARVFFNIPEIRDLVACYAVLFGWYGDERGEVAGAVKKLAEYVDKAIVHLGKRFASPHPLAEALQQWIGKIAALQEGETLDLRPADYFYRLLVHQSIEDIHRIALDGRLHTLDEVRIRELFERTFRFLYLSSRRPIGDKAKELAFTQVINYFRHNQDSMNRIIETEVDVSLEKDGYILIGKVDLLLGGDGKLELLDFKTSPRPKSTPDLIAAYGRQLCTYAHILEQRHSKHVDRLLLYWTAEKNREDALMVLPYRPEWVEEAGRHFDETVNRIQTGQFVIKTPPEAKICQECDLRMLCHAEGVIGWAEAVA